jgi:flagellar hook assembly protein FlgD
MKIFPKARRRLAYLSVLAIAATTFFTAVISIPLALAASPVLNNITYSPDPFYFNVPGQAATLSISYDYNTGGYATGPVIEQIKDTSDNVIYEWGNYGADEKATATYSLKWDGKYKNGGANDGQYVPDGQYKIYISSTTASLPAAVYLSPYFKAAATVAATLSLIQSPPAIYYTGNGGNYTLNYALTTGTSNVVAVRLKIKGPMNNNPTESVVATNQNAADGNYTIAWNGQLNNVLAAAGEYQWTLYAISSVNGYSVDGTTLTGNFTVSNNSQSNPTLSNLSVSPNPYDPNDGSITLNYTLNGSVGFSNLSVGVYSNSDLNNAIKTWTFSNQASGTNSVVWDGRNANNQKVSDGAYTFKVWGTDGNFTIVPAQIGFTVEAVSNPPASNCSGFTDVAANSSDCDAITYVKSIGAMTGNPNGTFAPSDLLQRDQVAKIVLETFNKFNSQNDYCNSNNPFPDVLDSGWAYQYICRGKSLGMITGYKSGVDSGYYRPARSVNRVEFLALLLRNLNVTMPANDQYSYGDVAINQWYTGYAKYSYDNSLFTGSKLYPTNFTTRAEVARVIYKLHQLGKI